MFRLWIPIIVFGLGVASTPVPGRPEACARTSPLADTQQLTSLLELMPSVPLVGLRMLHYSDFAQQLDAFGLAGRPSEAEMADWRLTLVGMEFPRVSDLADPYWADAFDSDLWDVDRMLELAGEETGISIFRGRFDAATLRRAWEASDYTVQAFEGTTYYSADCDSFLDFGHPAHVLHGGQFSYFLAAGDDTVVATVSLVEMEDVNRVEAGLETSMAADHLGVVGAVPSDLVTARVLNGDSLQPRYDGMLPIMNNPNIPEDRQESLATQMVEMHADVNRMPPIATALLGCKAGDLGGSTVSAPDHPELPSARAIALLVPESAADAGTVTEVVSDRFEHYVVDGEADVMERRYTEIFMSADVGVSDDFPVVLMQLERWKSGTLLLGLTEQRCMRADADASDIDRERNLS